MTESQRAALAAVLILVWVGWCLWLRRRARRARPETRDGDPTRSEAVTLVAYASQSGTAAAMARKRAEALRAQGQVSLLPLNRVSRETLLAAREALFVVSTYGDGEPPDNGAGFARRFLNGAVSPPLDLSHLNYSVIALGDRAYTTFCAFGHALYEGLAALGARAREPLARIDGGAVPDPPGEPLQAAGNWQLLERRHLNPGSPGAPLYQIVLLPPGPPPAWRAGDVFVLRPDDTQLREYSVASCPGEGLLKLIVRLQHREDGSPGLGSGRLTQRSAEGEFFRGGIRPNPLCHTQDISRPILLVGAGSGLAGLRAKLAERSLASAAGSAWLIYGERCEKTDRPLAGELDSWRRQGLLAQFDRVFSRGSSPAYVQDILRKESAEIIRFVAGGADIYLCGSKTGMGEGVHRALGEILGAEEVEHLIESGRYRRDLY